MQAMYYRLNREDVIVETGGDWDISAVEHDCAAVVSNAVIGRRIWDFLYSYEVPAYMNALFFSCRRSQKSITLPYRCDAPDTPRFFKMTISPLKGQGLIVSHLSQPLNLPISQNCVTLSDRYSTEKCSVCCSFKVGDKWVDPFSSPSEFDFPKGLGLCNDCKKTPQKVVEGHHNGRTIANLRAASK